jgi:hypothetical protein
VRSWVFLATLASACAAEPAVTGTFSDGHLALSWPAVEEADGYHLFRIDRDQETEIVKIGEPRCSVPAQRFSLYTFEVRWKKAGAWLTAARGDVGTFPRYFKTGTFTLDCFGRDTWRFDENKNYEGHKGDLAIVSSQGGATILKIRGIYGISAGTPGGFGKIDPTRRKTLAEALQPGEIEARETLPASLDFTCRSGEGGLVHVRVAKMENPRVTFRYVFVMMPEVEDMLAELRAAAPPPAEGDEAKIGVVIDMLSSKDTNERLLAEEAIVKEGARAAAVIERRMKEAKTVEDRDRLEAVLRKVWEAVPQDVR